jgi:hypothetical protein
MIKRVRRSGSQTDELNLILAEQLQSAKLSLKTINRFLKLMPNDPWLLQGKKIVEKRIDWYESMITEPSYKRKRVINIRRTLTNIKYYVRFIHFFKKRKN